MTYCIELAIEEWRPIVGFEGWYEVSNLGRVKRIKPGFSTFSGKILKGDINNGYRRVPLTVNCVKYRRRVNVIVAEAFLGPRPDKMIVNHKDTDKLNNRLDNLEYITHKENTAHAIMMGVFTPKFTCKPPSRPFKLTREQVEFIRSQPRSITGKSLAKHFGVSECLISDVRNHKCKVPPIAA